MFLRAHIKFRESLSASGGGLKSAGSVEENSKVVWSWAISEVGKFEL